MFVFLQVVCFSGGPPTRPVNRPCTPRLCRTSVVGESGAWLVGRWQGLLGEWHIWSPSWACWTHWGSVASLRVFCSPCQGTVCTEFKGRSGRTREVGESCFTAFVGRARRSLFFKGQVCYVAFVASELISGTEKAGSDCTASYADGQ